MTHYVFSEDHRAEVAGRLDILSKTGLPIAGVLQVAAILNLLQDLDVVSAKAPAEPKGRRKAAKSVGKAPAAAA